MEQSAVSSARVASLHIGMPVSVKHGSKEVLTAIFKNASTNIHKLSYTGLEGDDQGDKVHHGGPDKALCVYFDHWYPYWENKLGQAMAHGAFGENLTVSGWTEDDVCIGDELRIGSAVVQVSQPRQPCFKLGLRNDSPTLPAECIEKGNTGFYLRVLQEGEISAGDDLVIVKRHPARLSIAEANRVMYKDKQDRAGLEALLGVAELADAWRKPLAKRLAELD